MIDVPVAEGIQGESRSRAAARWLSAHGRSLSDAARRFDVTPTSVILAWRAVWPGREIPSDRDDQIVALATFGYYISQIADQVSVSDSTVSRVLARRGVVPRSHRTPDLKRLDEAAALVRSSQVTVAEAAARLNVRDFRLQHHLSRRGVFLLRGSTRARMDGRIARAVARVVVEGMTVAEASAAECCASAGVYRALRVLRAREAAYCNRCGANPCACDDVTKRGDLRGRALR